MLVSNFFFLRAAIDGPGLPVCPLSCLAEVHPERTAAVCYLVSCVSCAVLHAANQKKVTCDDIVATNSGARGQRNPWNDTLYGWNDTPIFFANKNLDTPEYFFSFSREICSKTRCAGRRRGTYHKETYQVRSTFYFIPYLSCVRALSYEWLGHGENNIIYHTRYTRIRHMRLGVLCETVTDRRPETSEKAYVYVVRHTARYLCE